MGVDLDAPVLAECLLPFLRVDVYSAPRKGKVFYEQFAVPFATGALQLEEMVDYIGLERVVRGGKALSKEVDPVEVLFPLLKVIG